VIKPLLNFVRRRHDWPMRFVVVDQGYVNAKRAAFLRRRWQVAEVVRPRKDMKPPAGSDQDGCPICPLGERLVFEDYDREGWLIYRGSPSACGRCPLAGGCPRQFEYEAGRHETFWGMLPSHSQLAQRILRHFRPRVESGFNLTKNKYQVGDFFLNGIHLTKTLCLLSDLLETLEILALERPQRGQETRSALIGDIFHPELWD